MTPQEEIKDAEHAKQLLEDPLLKRAFDAVEEALLQGMKSAAIVDDKLRLRLLDRLEMVHALKQVLQGYMETGKLARATLELEERRSLFQRVRDIYG